MVNKDRDRFLNLDESLLVTVRYYFEFQIGLGDIWKLAEKGFLFRDFQRLGSISGGHVKNLIKMIELLNTKKKDSLLGGNLSNSVKGRYLAFDPFATMYDGLSEEASSGFFDSDDVPPPEFWVGVSDDRLVSFIPVDLFDVVSQGIDACMSGCLEWLTDEFVVHN